MTQQCPALARSHGAWTARPVTTKPQASPRRWWPTLVRSVLAAAGVGYLAWALPGEFGAAWRSFGHLPQLRWAWLILAVALAVASLAGYGEMHRRLLAVGHARVPSRAVQEITFAQNAVSQTVPAVGGPASAGYAVSQLRRLGVDTALATWAVVLAGLVTGAVFLPLGVAALAWAGLVSVPVAVVAGVVAAAAISAAGVLVTRPRVLRGVAGALVGVVAHLPGVRRVAWAAEPHRSADRLAARLAALRPTAGGWGVLLVLAAGTWVFDYLTLAASFAAFSTPVPWATLAVGYLVVQVSIAAQITPGGAGLADAGLFGVLVASGVAAGPAAAAALTYRGIAWLGMALLGWAAYGRLSLQRPQPLATVTALPAVDRDEARAA